MLSYKDFLVRQERYRDLRREADRERLIRAVGLRRPGTRLPWKVTDWVGAQMVRWGWKLQCYGSAPQPLLSANCQVAVRNWKQ